MTGFPKRQDQAHTDKMLVKVEELSIYSTSWGRGLRIGTVLPALQSCSLASRQWEMHLHLSYSVYGTSLWNLTSYSPCYYECRAAALTAYSRWPARNSIRIKGCGASSLTKGRPVLSASVPTDCIRTYQMRRGHTYKGNQWATIELKRSTQSWADPAGSKVRETC